jgi:hypothetical protein
MVRGIVFGTTRIRRVNQLDCYLKNDVQKTVNDANLCNLGSVSVMGSNSVVQNSVLPNIVPSVFESHAVVSNVIGTALNREQVCSTSQRAGVVIENCDNYLDNNIKSSEGLVAVGVLPVVVPVYNPCLSESGQSVRSASSIINIGRQHEGVINTGPLTTSLDSGAVNTVSGNKNNDHQHEGVKHTGPCAATVVQKSGVDQLHKVNVVTQFFKGPHEVNTADTCQMKACLDAWRVELRGDPESDFLLEGIDKGFVLTDLDFDPVDIDRRNYASASVSFKEKTELTIKNEIELCRYIVVDKKPLVVSSIGSILKPNKDIRLIHDLSRPHGGVNAYSDDNSVSYATINDATRHIKKGSFLAKIDLKSAYRSVPISAESFKLTGLKWIFSGDTRPTYMYDCRLPFGASKSCKIFTSISDAVSRFFAKRGFRCLNYIDDFLVIADSESECRTALTCLLDLIHSLGLVVNWSKVEGPASCLTFLGVEICCVRRTLSLPPSKLASFKKLVATWVGKHKSTKKDLQSFIGKLNWAARVVQGGRTFLRQLINLLPKARESHHYIRISKGARQDIAWWDSALIFFHGNTPFICDEPLPAYQFSTDACLEGGGAHFCGDWVYFNWKWDFPEMVDSNINVLELKTVLEGAKRWGPLWEGLHVCVLSDNKATVSAVNKGTSRSENLLPLVHELFWLSVRYSFKLSARFLPGLDNVLADRISRMDQMVPAIEAHSMLSNSTHELVFCSGHMTLISFIFLQDRWRAGLVA